MHCSRLQARLQDFKRALKNLSLRGKSIFAKFRKYHINGYLLMIRVQYLVLIYIHRRLYVYNKHNARAIPNLFSNFADYWWNLTICFSSNVINVIANKTLYLSMTNSRDLRDSYYTYIVWTSALKFFLRRISFIRVAARHRRRVMEFRKTAASRTAGREKKNNNKNDTAKTNKTV